MTFTLNELIEIIGYLSIIVGVYTKLNGRIITLQVNGRNSQNDITEMKAEMKKIEDDNIKSIKEVTAALHENSIAVRELRAVMNQINLKK